MSQPGEVGVAEFDVGGGQGLVDFEEGGAVKAGVHGAGLTPGGHQAGGERGVVGGEGGRELAV